MHVRRLLLCFTIAAFLAVFALPAAAQPARPQGTIQSLIDATPNGGTVNVPAGAFAESLVINKDLTLSGQGPAASMLQALGGNRVIWITPNHTVTLQHLTITGGEPPSAVGGGVFAEDSALTVTDCVISGNSADYGGGIFQSGTTKTVTITNSAIEDNYAAWDGGGLFVKGELRMTHSDVLRNAATRHGGGIHADDGAAIIQGGHIANNEARTGNGGGLNVNRDLQLTGVVVSANLAGAEGGGALQYNAGWHVTVQGGRFENNHARTGGGGLWASADTSVSDTTFSGNYVHSGNADNVGGGGLYVTTGSLLVTNATFTNNTTDCVACDFNKGGAIDVERTVDSQTPTTIQASSFESNRAWIGSAMSSSGNVLNVRKSRFVSNGTQPGKNAGYGGAIDASAAAIEDSLFLGNEVLNQGGALAVGMSLSVDRSEFRDNVASAGGGAIWASGPSVLTNVLLVGNTGASAAALLFNNNVARTVRYTTIAAPAPVNAPAVSMRTDNKDANVGTLDVRDSIIVNHKTGVEVGTGTMTGSFTTDYSLYKNTTNFTGAALSVLGHTLQGVDPLFVSPAAGNYSLTPRSPAVDSGADLGVAVDLLGTPRPQGRGYDMGAYEWLSKVYLPLLRR